MQKICSNLLLLTHDSALRDMLLAKLHLIGVPVVVAPETAERTTEAFIRILATSDCLDTLSHQDLPNTYVVLGKNEEPELLYGVTHFVYDVEDIRQLKAAVYLSKQETMDYRSFSLGVGRSVPVIDYDGALLDFQKGIFRYNGQEFYLSDKNKLILVQWLTVGMKTTSTYALLARLRAKLGAGFMKGYKRGM